MGLRWLTWPTLPQTLCNQLTWSLSSIVTEGTQYVSPYPQEPKMLWTHQKLCTFTRPAPSAFLLVNLKAIGAEVSIQLVIMFSFRVFTVMHSKARDEFNQLIKGLI